MDCYETCTLCKGLRGHHRLKEDYSNIFKLELLNAKKEYQQLGDLFDAVCWYNFETRCKSWKEPWNISYLDSSISLKTCNSLNNTTPYWYCGSLHDAPHLPPVLVLKELMAAKKYLQFMQEQITAPFDWAPGGKKYEELLRRGAGVKRYQELQLHSTKSKRH